jgi:serine/threonine protein kinase
MAPEMLLQRYQPRRVRVGYTIAVDYYSLGVTLFKLLTGARPFNRDQIRSFAEIRECSDSNIGYKKYQVSTTCTIWQALLVASKLAVARFGTS